MNTAEKIAQWADTIKTQAQAIQEHMQKENNPNADLASKPALAISLPYDLEQSRDRILDAMEEMRIALLGRIQNTMEEMRIALLGPVPYLQDTMTFGIHIQSSLSFVYNFRVAQKLQPTEIVSYEELAERCQVHVFDLQRFLRYLITYRIFSEPSPNMVKHSVNSQFLLSVPGLDDILGMYTEDMGPASMCTAQAMTKWPMSLDPTHTGFALANGSEKEFFTILGENPARAERFGKAMGFLSASSDQAISLIFDDLDWDGDQCPQKVVDVGGSRGGAAIELLRRFPKIELLTVQDLPHVIKGASVPDDLTHRLNFIAKNFFDKQAIEDCDVFFIRNILHDWPDREAISILKNLASVLKPGGRIVVNEMCLPEQGQFLPYQERRLRRTDITMKYILNGGERDRERWKSLVSQVDSRLCIRRILTPSRSRLSIVEISWKPKD